MTSQPRIPRRAIRAALRSRGLHTSRRDSRLRAAGEATVAANALTLATIREWAERTAEICAEAEPHSHAGGMRTAARDVLALLEGHERPPEPVILPSPAEDD
jgi:hypothetical protein